MLGTWCSPHSGLQRRRLRRGWSRGKNSYRSCWDRSPDADGEAVSRTINAFEEQLAKEERESSTGEAGLEPPEPRWQRHGEGFGSERGMRLQVLAGPRGPPLSSALFGWRVTAKK